MKKSELLSRLREELELESELTLETDLKQLPEWDSLTNLMLIGFVENNFQVILTVKDLEGDLTVKSLIDSISNEKFQPE
jgi:acyl carrier protein